MEFVIFNQEQKDFYSNEIIAMMIESDKDFIPPLSARSSTLQSDLKGGSNALGDVKPYFNEMIKQEILGVLDGQKLLGFVSFRKDFLNEKIASDTLPNIYLSTLILSPDARGKGLTVKMYDHLFNTLFPDRNIFTRTWSTNFAHTKILSKFDFAELARIKNDRGNGIDTVYFSKIRN